MRIKRLLFAVLCACLTVAGCVRGNRAEAPHGPAPTHPSYLLAGRGLGHGTNANALVIFDPDRMQVWREVKLPPSWAKELARDPQGRLWIGLSGDMNRDDTRLLIFSRTGDLIQTIRPCTTPEHGVAFVGGKALIGCTDRGFQAEVALVDLETLRVEKTARFTEGQSTREGLFLWAFAATDEAVVLALGDRRSLPGTTDEMDLPTSTLILLDPQTLKERSRIALPFPALISQIRPVPGQPDRFLLLNNNYARIKYPDLRLHRPELLTLNTTTGAITETAAPPLPLRAAWQGGSAYILHGNYTGPIEAQPLRLTHLQPSQAASSWSLPEWALTDLAVYQGRLYLVRESAPNPEDAGLYQVDPHTQQLIRKLPFNGALRVLFPDGL